MKTTTLQNSNIEAATDGRSKTGVTSPRTRLSPAKAGKTISLIAITAALGWMVYGALAETGYLDLLQTHQPAQMAYASNVNIWTMMASQGR